MSYKFLSTILGINANFTGRLGVGTTTPGYPLEVTGTAPAVDSIAMFTATNSTEGLGVYNSASSNPQPSLRFFHNTSSYRIWLYGAGNLAFVNTWNGGTPLYNFFGSGNFGIGVGFTDAGYKLDVNGTARIQGATRIITSSALNGTQFLTIDVTSSGNIVPGGVVGLGVGISGTYTDNNSSNNTVYNPFINITAGISTSYNLSGTSRTFINFSPFVSNAGSDLNNNTYVLGISPSFTSRNVNNITGIYYNPTFTLTGSNNNHRAIHTVTGDVIFGSTSGNVGIGTTSPATKLDVVGDTKITGSASTGNYSLSVYNSSNAISFYVRGYGDAFLANTLYLGTLNGSNFISNGTLGITSNQGAGNQFVRFTHNNGNNAFRILSNSVVEINPSAGNVLIGTTTDAGYKLDVNGTARIVGVTTFNNNITQTSGTATFGNGIILDSTRRIFGASTITYQSNSAASQHYFGNYISDGLSGTLVTIGNGSGTFGTTSASNFLNISGRLATVSGTNNLTSILLNHTVENTGTYTGTIRGIYYAPSSIVGTGFTHRAIETTTGDVIFNSTSGSVGIGTTSPAYKLQVAGDIGFTAGANRYIRLANPAASGSANHIIIQGASANTSGTGGNIYLYEGSGAGGPGPGSIYIGATTGWTTTYITGQATISSTGPNTGTVFQVNAGGQNGLTINWNNTTPFMGYGLVVNRQSRFYNSSSYTFDNNLIVGSNTNSGEKLQVNGSGNFNLGNSGYIKLQSGSGQRHGFIQSAFSNFLFSNNVYYDGSNWRYDQNGYGAQIQTETLSTGVIAFNTFASGTGGSVATIIESMRIANSGNILMGDPNDYGFKLQVNGTSIFSDTIIQNYGNNSNASRGITSYIAQSNLTNDYTNGFYSGETISGELASTVVAGQVLAMKANSLQWELADASTAASIGKNMLGIACYDGNSTDVITILLNGFFASGTYYNNSGNYGVPMYLNASTNGSLTDVAPSTTGNIVRIVGHIDDYSNSNGCAVVRFNPDNFWLVI